MGLLDTLKHKLGGAPPRTTTPGADLEKAIALHEAGEIEQAEALYRSLLAAQPRHPAALHLLGVALHQRGEHMAALQSINAAILADPGIALFHFNLGNVLVALGEREAAASAYAEATRLEPGHAAAWFNLAKTQLQASGAERALPSFRHAWKLDPALPGLRFDYAAALVMWAGQDAAGRDACEEASALLEGHWEEAQQPASARLMLAWCLQQQGELSLAADHYGALKDEDFAPGDRLRLHLELANCCNQLGRVEEALHHYRQALRLEPGHAAAASSLAAFINYHPDTTPQDVLQAHRDWSLRQAIDAQHRYTSWDNDHDPGRTLRVGLVSADLRRHPVAALCAAMLERMDRQAVEVHCYYNFASRDQMSERLRKATAGWRDIANLNDEQAAHLIRQDGMDILIDLAGHTSHNRLGLFARKPAPVQASWLGYFNTTGLQAMDYFISDPHSSPPGQEAFFSEKLLRLPHTRFCYEPWEWTPQVNALPALQRGHITFGSLNNIAKLNGRVLALWSHLLQAVPGSRLLVQAQALDDQPNRQRFADLAARTGIARERLELRGFAPLERAAHAYYDIDIALDPFPFCGGMTSFDALWMGVPVVTLEQPMIAGRQTLSMLRNLQLDELIADSEARYLDIASALAGDAPRLAGLRQGLRQRFAASPLADYQGFARDFSAALRAMWRTWCEAR